MTIPTGFVRCDECEGSGIFTDNDLTTGEEFSRACPVCSGSGLLPTEKLREDVTQILYEWIQQRPYDPSKASVYGEEADAVLRKVAEHLGDRE